MKALCDDLWGRVMNDDWTETLECPKCGKNGTASLSQDMSDDNSIPIVRSLCDGFRADIQSSGPKFYCQSCNVLAKP